MKYADLIFHLCLQSLITLQSMYQGVLKDDERRFAKMKQRQEEFEESKRRRELYERVQKVQGTGNSDSP